MALLPTVELEDSFDTWRIKTNLIGINSGDLDNLVTTNKSSLVAALNELDGLAMTALVQDLSPELGGDLGLNNFDITGTGNINITGSYTGTLTSTVTAITQSPNDNSTKIATTEYADRVLSSFTDENFARNMAIAL